VELLFPEGYPIKPPMALLPRNFFHPNVFPTGHICLSILKETDDINQHGWSPNVGVRGVLMGIQTLLDEPNNTSPAQDEAYRLLKDRPAEYARRVREQARRYVDC
jgi:ubiquitin-conjugating enzyme E2 I